MALPALLPTPPPGTPERRQDPDAPRCPFAAVVRGIAKPIRLEQLAAEMAPPGGAPPALHMCQGLDATVVVLADVDQAALGAAVAAHVAVDPNAADLATVAAAAATNPAFAALARLARIPL